MVTCSHQDPNRLEEHDQQRLTEDESRLGGSNALQLRFDYDTSTIRLRYDDTTTHSTATEVIEITIRLRYDCDPTTTYCARLLPFDAIRREQKINILVFRSCRVVVVS